METRYSWFDFEVLAVPAANRYGAGREETFAATWLPGTMPRPDFTDHRGGKVAIRYGRNHTSLVKPFIIVEGYNTAAIAPHMVGKNNQNNTIDEFLNKTAVDPTPFDFNENLERADYDIVYLDFANGTDDIRRNAALFEDVLRWVNQQKALNGSTEANTFIDGPYRDMITFPAGGPQPTYQIIATSDGSQCGRPQNTAPHTELSRTNNEYLLLPYVLRGGVGMQSEAVTNALPAYGTTERIAHLRVWFRIKILFARMDLTLLNRNYQSPPNTLSYDILPGGNENLTDQADLLGNYGNGFLGFWRLAMNTKLYNGDICFVPSYSALDVEQVTPATAFAKYLGGVTDNTFQPRVSRFIANENLFGSRYNLPHLRFTARNAEWLFREMQNDQPGTVLCAALTECAAPGALPVTGPATLCGNGTYSLPIQGNGLTYSWTASPANLFTTTSGTGPTFTTSNVGSGQGTITVTVTGPAPLPLHVP